jgi:hypothetical protein
MNARRDLGEALRLRRVRGLLPLRQSGRAREHRVRGTRIHANVGVPVILDHFPGDALGAATRYHDRAVLPVVGEHDLVHRVAGKWIWTDRLELGQEPRAGVEEEIAYERRPARAALARARDHVVANPIDRRLADPAQGREAIEMVEQNVVRQPIEKSLMRRQRGVTSGRDRALQQVGGEPLSPVGDDDRVERKPGRERPLLLPP